MSEKTPFSRPLGRRQAARELFRSRDFKLLWIGQLLSQIGDQCLLIAAITLISNLSQSPLAMLIPALSMAIPQVIFGLVGGVMADRWNRKGRASSLLVERWTQSPRPSLPTRCADGCNQPST